MTHVFGSREREDARRLIRWALEEDRAREDLTSRLAVEPGIRGQVWLRNRQPGVLAGIECVALVFEELGAQAEVEVLVPDGTFCSTPTRLARAQGRLRDLLAAERTFLNLVCVLSGTATLTRRFAEAAGPRCKVLDTRKTWPGYRYLQKYAVRCGGGTNHRMHLADGVLLKDNHRHHRLGLAGLVRRAREEHAGIPVVLEVDDLEQLREALGLRPERVLLDNFDAERVREAVAMRDELAPRVGLEVSGGVNLDTIGPLAAAGADYASVGALTHSAPAWDVGLDRDEDLP